MADATTSAVDFMPPVRIQSSLLATQERALLIRLCHGMPRWVTPDRLTALGSIGAVIMALGYIGSNWRPQFLLLSSLGVVVNWFGDSLDGSLARYRRVERPRYGYFLDHSVDVINVMIFMVGLGASPYVSMDAALLLLCSYYLLNIYVYLSAQVNREFNLARVYIGPTELRVIIIVFNVLIFAIGPRQVTIFGEARSIYTLLVLFEATAFVSVFICDVVSTARKLKREEKRRRRAMAALTAAANRL